jgi:hypothetical protein
MLPYSIRSPRDVLNHAFKVDRVAVVALFRDEHNEMLEDDIVVDPLLLAAIDKDWYSMPSDQRRDLLLAIGQPASYIERCLVVTYDKRIEQNKRLRERAVRRGNTQGQ